MGVVVHDDVLLSTEPGGASLNMTDERDRGLLRRKVDDGPKRRRWPEITDEFKADAVRALKVALRMSLEAKDHRGINGCVKTLALLEGQNQKDDHAMLDKPGVTVNLGVAVQNNLPSNDPSLMREIVAIRARLAERDMADTVHRPALNGNGNGAGH